MSFLEKEDEPSSAIWDWVIGVGLLVLVGGFTFYYQYQKRSSRERFQQADSLFQAGKFRKAVRLYDKLQNAQYLTTKNDSLIYARTDSIETMEDHEKDALGRIRSKLLSGDTVGARTEIKADTFQGLLEPEDQTILDSIRQKLGS